MDTNRHQLLVQAGPFFRDALFNVAVKHQLTVDVVVQRLLERELPGAPPEFVTRADAAAAEVPATLLAQARVDYTGRALGLPVLDAKATEEQRSARVAAETSAVTEMLRQALESLVETWPQPSSYGPPRAAAPVVMPPEPPAPAVETGEGLTADVIEPPPRL